jgi:hypothetical protein
MGERKVLNFYIAPDFDRSILPRLKRDWDKLIEVRTMLPFSIRCDTCGEYMYRGKKFNSKKEMIKGEDYLGIRKFRFYIKCSVCSAEIAFKTDPKNSDYEMEWGASRNFELWRDTDEAISAEQKKREEEDNVDAMKSLENRTMDSKIEMDMLDALDEMKSINQRHERVDTNAVIESLYSKSNGKSTLNANGITDEDEKLVKSINFKSKAGTSSENVVNSSDSAIVASKVSKSLSERIKDEISTNRDAKKKLENMSKLSVVKKRKAVEHVDDSEKISKTSKVEDNIASASKPAITVLLGEYGESSEDD